MLNRLKQNVRLVTFSMLTLAVVLAITMTSVVMAFAAPHKGNPLQNTWNFLHNEHGGNVNDHNFRGVTHIAGLTRISEVGSTAVVVDAKGKTVQVDPNPYGIAIVPANAAKTPNGAKPGDVLVTDIGNNHDGNIIVRFPKGQGPAHNFNMPDANAKEGPAMHAINAMAGVDWVSDLAGNNEQIFDLNGKLVATLTNPLFNHPWGMTFNQGLKNRIDGSIGSFFSSNAGDATIDRIDIIPVNGKVMFKVIQIGQLTKMEPKTKIGLNWVPSINIGGHKFNDVLLALDPANNRIAAFPNSTTFNTPRGNAVAVRAINKGLTAFQGKPLNVPAGFTISPFDNDNLLVVNSNDNNLVEVDTSVNKVMGVRQLDNVPVDQMNGNGSALFGVAATKDERGNLKVFFTDDNTNTLDVLSVS